jgi:hypothetical protein
MTLDERLRISDDRLNRPHMALEGDSPARRVVERPAAGEILGLSRVGGLHHRYSRAA